MRTQGLSSMAAAARFDGLGDTLQDRARRAIAHEIENGTFAPGDRLPAEKDLATQLGMSLAPVRGALDQLAQRGIVVRSQGKGTFVQERRVPYRLESWRSCTDDLRAQGIDFDVRVLAAEDDVPPPDVAVALGVDGESLAAHLVRIISVQGRPGILLDSWTRGVTLDDLGGARAFEDGRSLYGALAALGITIVRAETAIEVSFADELESAVFGLPYASALLQVTGVSSAADGPREWSRLKYNASTFSLNMQRVVRRTS